MSPTELPSLRTRFNKAEEVRVKLWRDYVFWFRCYTASTVVWFAALGTTFFVPERYENRLFFVSLITAVINQVLLFMFTSPARRAAVRQLVLCRALLETIVSEEKDVPRRPR